MWYVAGVCVVVLLSTVVGLTRNKSEVGSKSIGVLDALTAATPSDFTPEAIMSLSVTQVNILLARLENEEAPFATRGAMCYEAMAAPEVAEYICPSCGEKTIYNYNQSEFILWGLPGCRRMIESINSHTDFNMTLDESLFCDFCSPDTTDEEPFMFLRVSYEDGTEVVNKVYVIDLMRLDSFLQGNLFYLNSTDGQIPLKDSADRLRELLGLEK